MDKKKKIYEEALENCERLRAKNLNIDISRGKPCKEQLDLSNELLTCLDENDLAENTIDFRNYGIVDGIKEAKVLFAELMGVGEENIIVSGNSTLTLIYNLLINSFVFGVLGCGESWSKQNEIKFLCPCPGYDRHFLILEKLGIQMINIDLNSDGPDMDAIEKMVEADETIKGIICVPMYSNPTGISFSDEVVDRFAKLKPKAKDFRIYWDNAYCVHHLYEKKDTIKNLLVESKKYGNENQVYMFASTSKITWPGSGVAVIVSSAKNIKNIANEMSVQTIGPDKINQYRHVKYLKSVKGIEEVMKKHAAIIRPKFELVHRYFEKYLGEYNVAKWSYPNGGYFINLDVLDGCASEIVKMAADLGVKLTSAGSSYPYKKDAADKNIRIAPTYIDCNELELALEILCNCILVVTMKRQIDL